MATLILTAVGTLFGGPVGGAIGSLLGQQVDSRIFAPKARMGPRLNDLKVQTSSYGAPLPKLYGRTRIAGTVIWATDLKEDKQTVSSGKGSPKQTVFSYSANFAVVLSARRVERIGRIWADGKLLRGEAGDFKTPTGFRLYNGSEGQNPDPLISSVEGVGGTPAYRDMTYAVFEGFQLNPYGNRIPSLSFEVIADEVSPNIGSILSDLSAKQIDADCPTIIEGFAAAGDSWRGVAESLNNLIPLNLSELGGRLKVSESFSTIATIASRDLGAASEGRHAARIERERMPISRLPERRTIAYSDISRDYLPSTQSARRPVGGRREQHNEIAASLTADRARQLVENRIATDRSELERIKLHLPIRHLAIRPGQLITVTGPAAYGLSGAFGVIDSKLESMAVTLELKPILGNVVQATPADGGRPTSELDTLHGPTVIQLVDLPWLGEGITSHPAIYLAAGGTLPGWRKAGLLLSTDSEQSFEEIGSTASPAVMGSVVAVLANGATTGFDRKNWLDVELLNSGMTLESATEASLIGGKNLLLVGEELIQFGNADQVGPKRYRLRHLLRGRRGTEWAAPNHIANERVVLVDKNSLLPLAVAVGAPSVTVKAQGIGDVADVTATLINPHFALIPPSPVHLKFSSVESAFLELAWLRRSRDGWRWIDCVDAPLAEETERYRVSIAPDIGSPRTAIVDTPSFQYSVSDRALDLASGASQVTFSVSQIGTFGSSRSTSLTLSL
jgi:Putative phage tail protein